MASIAMKNQNEKSKYVPRALERSENRDKDILSPINDMEFARLPGPKVLLGAPGGGKTSVCEEVARQLNGRLVRANIMASGSFKCDPKFEGQILVIDGLDEVYSRSISRAFEEIIKTLERLGYRNWLVSCRSYEWDGEFFDPLIESAFGQFPKIAHLGDLSNDEIKAFLEIFPTDEPAEQFIKNAEQKEATDFLRNPQTLKMLVQAVSSGRRTETKKDLFESACMVMASEHNPLHQKKSSDRPNEEKIIEISGWVCTQFLMSGAQAIALDGRGGKKIPRPADLEDSPKYSKKDIEAACQTKIFKSVEEEAGRVEPTHRTVAEFLAGHWLAEQFKVNQKTVPPARRVMNFFTFGTETVSPSLRGLHAWITSLDVSRRLQNIKNDPYGCLRYGDLSGFSDNELIALLEKLVALTQVDPFFQGSDWNARFGHSLGRASIKEKFVEIISDANTSPHLKFTLLQAIQGTELAEAMIKELKAIVLNEDDDQFVRRIAVNVLAGNLQPNDWLDLAEKLLKCDTMNSLEISVDQIISREHVHFSGAEIAEHSIAYEKKAFDEEKNHIAVMKHEIPIICSDIQVAEIAKSIAAEIPAGRDKHRRDPYTKLEEWLAALLPRLLKRSNKPTADELWPLISRLSSPSHKSGWEKIVPPWFAEHDDIRREIQTRALDEGEDASAKRMALYWLEGISAGLDMGESDAIHHLERLIVAKDSLSNWQSGWEALTGWMRRHDSVLKLVKKQAEDLPKLKPILEEILRPPFNEHETEIQELRRQRKEEEISEIQQRHVNFFEVRKEMEKGEHLSALGFAAESMLGHYSDLKKTTSPKERIKEMVGQENVASVIKGFEVAVKKDAIPSVRECTDLHIVKNIELIAFALCMLMLESGKSLTSLPEKSLLCALSVSWSRGSDFENLSKELQLNLEEILFKDYGTKQNFVKDIIEPSLEVGEEHITGFHRITTEKLFSDILPDLALEWLAQYEKASDDAVWQLLKVAVHFTGDNTKLANLIETKLQNSFQASDEKRIAWHMAAFAVDFRRFRPSVVEFANESKDSLWAFKTITGYRQNAGVPLLKLNVSQMSFLLETFACKWPFSSHPSGTYWVDSKEPWQATDWLNKLIMKLGEEKSQEAVDALKYLNDSGNMDTYQDLVQHSLAIARQGLAETHHLATTLDDVRNILQSGKPNNVSDLQALFIEEFEEYQARTRTGHSDTYKTFWIEDEKPHVEDYCRDRLLDGLEQEMGSRSVRVHKEGAMADNTRVDLLLSCGNFDLPVEIKRQWHPDIWTAAHEQLERYSENYRTDGTGVYLVIWYGLVKGKSIPKPPIGKSPKSAEEMLQTLLDNSGDLSPKTKIVVLDVSKPASKKK